MKTTPSKAQQAALSVLDRFIEHMASLDKKPDTLMINSEMRGHIGVMYLKKEQFPRDNAALDLVKHDDYYAYRGVWLYTENEGRPGV